jgi:hypothetical protein
VEASVTIEAYTHFNVEAFVAMPANSEAETVSYQWEVLHEGSSYDNYHSRPTRWNTLTLPLKKGYLLQNQAYEVTFTATLSNGASAFTSFELIVEREVLIASIDPTSVSTRLFPHYRDVPRLDARASRYPGRIPSRVFSYDCHMYDEPKCFRVLWSCLSGQSF